MLDNITLRRYGRFEKVAWHECCGATLGLVYLFVIQSMQFKAIITTAVLSVFGLSVAKGITMVAGVNFQDNAFADSLISSSGTYTLGGAASLSAAVTGSSLSKFATSATAGANLQLGFTDNYLVNGSGFDLALFELGTPSTFAVTIGGVTHNYTSAGTGFTTLIGGTTYAVNEAQINLDDFGVASGAQLSTISIGMDVTPNVPALSVVAALNSAPVTSQMVPDAGSTISMLGLAVVGIGSLRRKLK